MECNENSQLVWAQGLNPFGLHYPISRVGFAMEYSKHQDAVLIFGGMASIRLNDVYLFRPSENRWSELKTTGKAPSERSFACTFLHENRFYVFGGLGEKDRSLGDCFVLFLDTLRWKQIFAVPSPEARHAGAFASHVYFKHTLTMDDVGLEETVKPKGNRHASFKRGINPKGGAKGDQLLLPKKSFFGTTSLAYFAKSVLPPEQVKSVRHYLFGGMSMPSDHALNDLWALSGETGSSDESHLDIYGFTWTKLSTSGEVR
jgi:hypothetical protein